MNALVKQLNAMDVASLVMRAQGGAGHSVNIGSDSLTSTSLRGVALDGAALNTQSLHALLDRAAPGRQFSIAFGPSGGAGPVNQAITGVTEHLVPMRVRAY